jgi:hypothetical protein
MTHRYMDLIRHSCAVCSGSLEVLYTIHDVPITCSPASMPIETDVVRDATTSVCTQCGCVQLKTLIDPAILYGTSHNETAETPTWKEHHKQFSQFVMRQRVDRLLEIGGSSGSLYDHIGKDVDYTCLDMCDRPDAPFKFVQGNCETYDFSSTDCICMSHVFEHLYNPRVFVENISPHVKKVILSIPNMNHLLTIQSPSIVFNEHTYFVDKTTMEWLFGQSQYVLRDFEEYKSHSLFMVFEKSEGAVNPPLLNRTHISQTMKAIFDSMTRRFSHIDMPDSAFIAPAGHMGQLVYSKIKPTTLSGFLDNDRAKQGRRVYGTPFYAQSFSALKGLQSPVVYLYAGVYSDEIRDQVISINSSSQVFII